MSDYIEHACDHCGSLLCPSTRCAVPTRRVFQVSASPKPPTVREAARLRMPLGGPDAQSLEGALSQVERELAAAQARALAAETQQTVLEEACERLSVHLTEVTADRDRYRTAWERDGQALAESTDALMRAHVAARHTMPDPDDASAWPLPRANYPLGWDRDVNGYYVYRRDMPSAVMRLDECDCVDGILRHHPAAPEIERVIRAREAARKAKHGGAK